MGSWYPFCMGAFCLACYFMPNPSKPSWTGLSWPTIDRILLAESVLLFMAAFLGKSA